MLFLIESFSSAVCCGTYPTKLHQENFLSTKLVLSIIIFPLLGSKKPDRRFIRVLFPEPVLPTIPTHSPFFIENVIFFNDGSSEFG